jgi:hypothetical protein
MVRAADGTVLADLELTRSGACAGFCDDGARRFGDAVFATEVPM